MGGVFFCRSNSKVKGDVLCLIFLDVYDFCIGMRIFCVFLKNMLWMMVCGVCGMLVSCDGMKWGV